jgi:hypothetical protein
MPPRSRLLLTSLVAVAVGMLMKASMILSPLVRKRAADEVARIKAEALAVFNDGDGGLNVEALTDPPKKTGLKKPLAQMDLEP